VVAATDDTELNDRISHVCMSENILVNNVSSKTEMNAMFTAVVKNDEFQIGIGSYGKSCRRSKALKGKVQELIDEIIIPILPLAVLIGLYGFFYRWVMDKRMRYSQYTRGELPPTIKVKALKDKTFQWIKCRIYGIISLMKRR